MLKCVKIFIATFLLLGSILVIPAFAGLEKENMLFEVLLPAGSYYKLATTATQVGIPFGYSFTNPSKTDFIYPKGTILEWTISGTGVKDTQFTSGRTTLNAGKVSANSKLQKMLPGGVTTYDPVIYFLPAGNYEAQYVLYIPNGKGSYFITTTNARFIVSK